MTAEVVGNSPGIVQEPLAGMATDPQIPPLLHSLDDFQGWHFNDGLVPVAGDFRKQAQALSGRAHIVIIAFPAAEINLTIFHERQFI